MTDIDQTRPQLPQVMPAGGQVTAVVPQSIEEIFRVSKGIVQSGLAPYALTGKLDTDAALTKAVSAVAVTIMAGAELGLPPMVALRSFTVINGRPALYGDGLINVIRRSKTAKKLEVGFVPGASDELGDDAKGYCFAIRADTGEEKRVEFTVRQAKRAGLWQTEAVVEKWNKYEKKKEKGPNDSPWYRYPERMLGWRAAGFCLRELFGDVLGGITDDWEQREISAEPRDITPPSRRELPPEPPAEAEVATEAQRATTEPEPSHDANGGQSDLSKGDQNIPENIPASTTHAEEFLTGLEEALSGATTEAEIESLMDLSDWQVELPDDDDRARAMTIRKDAVAALNRRNAEANGQGSLV